MALVYVDPSAMVISWWRNPAATSSELWDGCDAARSSRLAYPEMRAVLTSASRNHDLDAGSLADALTAWEEL